MIGNGVKVGVSPPRLPTTLDACSGQLGIVPTALYTFRGDSDNMTDLTGNGNTLVATNTPLYDRSVGGHRGISYASGSAASHAADVCSAGTDGLRSVVYSGIFIPGPDSGANTMLFGRTNAAAQVGVWCSMVGGQNYPSVTVSDVSVSAVTVNATGIDIRSQRVPVLISVQVDRANQLCRIRVSSQGKVLTEQSASIAALGSITTAPLDKQSFGSGAVLGALATDCSLVWLMAADGLQCEGADVLRSIARRLECE
jgi:hypothetical protein